jgi:Fe2+ or Zn2+ uptake regulation protein
MANLYYIHQSVKDPQEASIFSDEYTWMILDILRLAGNDGISAQSVHKEVERKTGTLVSQSKIYSKLKRLYQMKWVHRSYNREDEKLHNIINIDWGGILLDKTYEDILVKKERDYIIGRLFPIFIEFIKQAMNDLSKERKTETWLPKKESYCKVCQNSHEAQEFISSLLDLATSEFMDSEDYIRFMKENHFMVKEK